MGLGRTGVALGVSLIRLSDLKSGKPEGTLESHFESISN